MLVAHNQDNQPESANPQPSGFGKVLGSLHGLQQRLENFSIEEVSSAEANVKALIQKITFIRGQLTTVAELKQSITTANQQIESIPPENFDLVDPDSLAKHPQLHAIVKASKVIRFYRMMQAVRASTEAISFDSDAESMMASSADLSSKIGEPIQKENRLIEAQETRTTLNAAETAGETGLAGVDDFVAPEYIETLSEAPEPASLEIADLPLEPNWPMGSEINTEDSLLPAPICMADPQTDVISESVAQKLETEFVSVIPDAESNPVESSFVLVQAASAQTSIPESTSLAIIENVESPATEKINSSPPVTKNRSKKRKSADQASGQNKAAKDQAPLDHRLLDDLIKQYGDFAVSPNLPTPVETRNKKSKPNPAPTVAASVPEFDGPIFEKPAIANKSGGQIQKAGELDRQLKKIIKDYGEYDIYSRPGTRNLKTGAIIAFVVLGLVLGGIYFFRSPTPARTPETTTESSTPSDSLHGNPSESATTKTSGAIDSRSKEIGSATKTVTKSKN